MNKNLIAAVILTYNEEINIVKCINSVSFCDVIIVLDSYSNDKTTILALNSGAKVFDRKFDNYAAQRNYALDLVEKNIIGF